MGLACSVESSPEGTMIKMTGPIDEQAQFPENLQGNGLVTIDMNGVTYINSIGIKMWIQWITPVAVQHSIEFTRCPKAIIQQMNMVKNFFPIGARVKSFQIPLFCDACENESSLMIDVASGVQIQGEDVKVTASLPNCENCGSDEVEMDVIAKKYFRFLVS